MSQRYFLINQDIFDINTVLLLDFAYLLLKNSF